MYIYIYIYIYIHAYIVLYKYSDIYTKRCMDNWPPDYCPGGKLLPGNCTRRKVPFG